MLPVVVTGDPEVEKVEEGAEKEREVTPAVR
jgi:hypothetical protein